MAGGVLLTAAAVGTAAHESVPSTLKAREAALMALEKGLVIQSQVMDLSLQARELLEVVHGEFRPRTTLALSNQRQNTLVNSAPGQTNTLMSSTLQTTWRLLSGAQLSLRAAGARQSATGAPLGSDRSVTLGITQPLLRGRGAEVAGAGLRIAESALRSARIAFEQAASDTVHQVLVSYFDRQQAQVRVQQAQDALETARKVHALNQALVDAGRSARNVLLQSEADSAQARLSVAQSAHDESVALRVLLQAIGSDPDSSATRVETPDRLEDIVRVQVPDERTAIDLALAWQSSVRSAHENLQIARLQLRVAEDNQLIPLDLSVSVSRFHGAAPGAPRGDTAVALTTEIAFNRAELRLARSAAANSVRKAEMQLADAERSVRYATVDVLQQLRFAIDQQALAQTNASLVRDRLEAEVERLRVGRASVLEVSLAQQSLVSAQSQLLQAQYQVYRSKLEFLRVTGGLLGALQLDARVKQWTDEWPH